ncbi:voltage-dependent anion channel [Microdochium trichocladiopsis]|uniref:Voltage-dependent anion channel n=1 Tax=Microdochium trichocladiopsis TaxID=1682393 RepID=A0A9P8Y2Z7_9PEZI|nr:voltage-dependent anion channel [Microdochium trichocladiopsis]KAH7029519.1 voltage-dependent anion channel [Microdochium trichocladiopsis]
MAADRLGSNTTLAEPARSVALRNFGSAWFMIPQGTGILAVCFWSNDYQFRGLNVIALVAWATAIVSVLIITFTYLARLTCFPRHVASQLATDSSELASLASLPVTLTAIVQMLILVLGHYEGWSTACHILWWVVFGLSLMAVILIPQAFVTTSPPGRDNLLPNSQLPLVAALTAAATGGALCQSASLSTLQQLPIIAICYLLVGIAVPLAIFLDAIFLARLLSQTKETQEKESRQEKQAVAYQTMICAGPWGQSSVAFLLLGHAVLNNGLGLSVSNVVGNDLAAKSVAYVSIFIGFLFWGQATFWWIFTLLSITHAVFGRATGKRGVSFQMAMWSLVFPWGVYTNGAIQIGKILDSTVFRVWSAILTILMAIVWLVCTALTIRGCITGSLFGLEHGWRNRRDVFSGTSDEERGGRAKHW